MLLISYLQVTTVVFDKTGTITEGSLKVTNVLLFKGPSLAWLVLDRLLAIAGVAESDSEHPIGAAIASHVKKVEISFYTSLQDSGV